MRCYSNHATISEQNSQLQDPNPSGIQQARQQRREQHVLSAPASEPDFSKRGINFPPDVPVFSSLTSSRPQLHGDKVCSPLRYRVVRSVPVPILIGQEGTVVTGPRVRPPVIRNAPRITGQGERQSYVKSGNTVEVSPCGTWRGEGMGAWDIWASQTFCISRPGCLRFLFLCTSTASIHLRH